MSKHIEPLEPPLRDNLLALARAYVQVTGQNFSALSRYCHGDKLFLDTLEEQAAQEKRTGRAGSFTMRKYDEVVAWFAAHWPDGTPWPELRTISGPEKLVVALPSRAMRRRRAASR